MKHTYQNAKHLKMIISSLLPMRDDAWLETRFDMIWSLFFPDVEKKNVFVRWKGKWKNKFGHIRSTTKGTEIVVNSLFKDERVPDDIVKLTMAHEIVHYMHGFHSHLPRKFKHPHAHGVVDKALLEKGFGYILRKEKEWFKQEWLPLYRELCPHKVSQPRKRSFFKFSFFR